MLEDFPDDSYEDEDEAVYLRARRRVPVRRSVLFATRWGRIVLAAGALAVAGLLLAGILALRNWFFSDPRFRIETASSIQVIGNSEVSRTELLGVFGSDVGHNIFTVPLAARRAGLEQLAWVKSATVMRLLPNQLRVSIVERVPVAFVRQGNRIQLVDASGVILSMSPAVLAARHYSSPVVAGISKNDPPETRADRMQIYQKFVAALDSTSAAAGPKVSQQLSEVDVSDPEDVRALMPSAGVDILVHFGEDDFANRYRQYKSHLAQWRQQYPHLAAIDLRYDRQTVLEMASAAASDPANGAAPAQKIDTTPTLAAMPVRRAKPAAHKAAVKKPLHADKSKTKARKANQAAHAERR